MRFDFLICSERSGSNLITKVMDGHPQVCGPFPSHMIRTFAPNLYRYGSLRDDDAWLALTDDTAEYLAHMFAKFETSVSAQELRDSCAERSLAAIIRHVYEKEAAARGKTRVFVKENHAFGFVAFTLANFPDSRFVWLVRDPRDMALCQRGSILPGGVQKAAPVWKTDQGETLKVYGYLEPTGRILLLRFEDLLANSEAVCRRLCDFLELPYAPEMLEFYKAPNVARNAQWNTAWADLSGPILSENFGQYRRELSEAEIRYVEAVCAPEMRALGYEPDFPVGNAEELLKELPDEAQFEVARSAEELQRFEPWREVGRSLRKRWSSRGVRRVGGPLR
jgi:hypothetical protein